MRADGEWLADARGRWYVLYATCFPAVWLVLHDQALFVDTCQWLHARGCDGIRILGTTGPAFWESRDWDSQDSRFPTWLEHAIDVAWVNGLRTQLTIFGSDGYHRSDDAKQRFVDTCVAVANRDREKLLFIEVANEFYHPSILDDDIRLLRALGRRATDQTDIPIALSAFHDARHGEAVYRDAGVQVGTAHTFRAGSTGIPRDQVRHIPGFPRVRMDNEPRGIKASAGGDVRDPVVLANDLKESARHGIHGYCFHAEPLVWFGAHGRRAIWEEPEADACLRAIAAARDEVAP